MRIYKIVGIVLSAMLLLASCTNSDLEKKKVKIAYANWLEGIAMSHLAKVVLEEHGYEVELQNADLAPIFVSMSGKKSDVFLDAWLPITMKDYMDQYGDSIEFLGEVYGEARVGLVVPQYVTIQSISELEANKDRFSSPETPLWIRYTVSGTFADYHIATQRNSHPAVQTSVLL